MSLLCGCVSKKGQSSPSHTKTYSNKMSSKLKQPSTTTGRFGFSSNSQKQKSSSANNPPSELELKSVASCDTKLTGGLALDPSALLMRRGNDNLGGYVPRNVSTDSVNNKPRPISSIAALGRSHPPQESHNGYSSFDDTKAPAKPKSTLRSLFSRSFTRDKAVAAKSSKLSASSNSNMNNSKSDGNLGGFRQHPRGSVGSTGSSSSNHSTDSTSKLGFKRGSRPPSRAQTSSPTSSVNHSDDNKTTKPAPKSLQSKLATATSKSSATSLPKSSNSGLARFSSQNKSKPSKLSLPASKQSTELTSLHNNNVSSDECKEGINIDRDCYDTIKDASAPVARGDTDSETSFNSSTELSSQSTANGLISTRTARSMSAGSNSSDKKKPTVEINPITKEDNPTVVYLKEEQSEKMGVNDKPAVTKHCRTFSIDEDLLSSIMAEVASLRSTVVELQHHLIGKQEYEEKMREELKIKNEIINNLQHELAQCVCKQQNRYASVADEELVSAVR